MINIVGSLIMMPLFGHVGLGTGNKLFRTDGGCRLWLVCSVGVVRLGGGWRGMMGRIFLATMPMVIVTCHIDDCWFGIST